ncbi:MAG: glutaredoxin family protein [Methylococcales bacterium]|nr:glutaredoxin family protein [Methylococcales bacterium]
MLNLLLLGTSACHLCEQAEEIIAAYLADNAGLAVESVDIALQEQWQGRYALRIPVLYHANSQKDLGWPFDQAQVEAFIKGLPPGLGS